MSTSPVTLMVARRVADGRYQDLIAWLREGEQLATDFPGYLGSGVLAPPPGDNEFQIIFRFVDEQTLHAWEHSASRTAWLSRGSDLFAHPKEHRVSGCEHPHVPFSPLADYFEMRHKRILQINVAAKCFINKEAGSAEATTRL